MGTNGNGHAIPREDDDSDTDRDHAMKRPETPVEVAEYVRAAVETSTRTAGEVRTLRDDIAKRDTLILSSLARIEHTTTTTKALAEETAIRVAVLARDTDATDRAVADAEKAIADLHKAVAARGTGYSPNDAAALARLEARVEALKERADRIENDVDDSKQMAAVSLAEARAKLASVADVVDEKREVRREERDDRRHTKRWALGLVGTVVLTVLATLLGVHAAAPVEVHEPAALPAGH